MTRGKVIQPHHGLFQFQQSLQQVGAYKTCHTGNQPGRAVLQQMGFDIVVSGHGYSCLFSNKR